RWRVLGRSARPRSSLHDLAGPSVVPIYGGKNLLLGRHGQQDVPTEYEVQLGNRLEVRRVARRDSQGTLLLADRNHGVFARDRLWDRGKDSRGDSQIGKIDGLHLGMLRNCRPDLLRGSMEKLRHQLPPAAEHKAHLPPGNQSPTVKPVALKSKDALAVRCSERFGL